MWAKVFVFLILVFCSQISAARNPFLDPVEPKSAHKKATVVQCEPGGKTEEKTVVVEKIVEKRVSEFDVSLYEFRGEVNDTLVLFNKEKQTVEYVNKNQLKDEVIGKLRPAVGKNDETVIQN